METSTIERMVETRDHLLQAAASLRHAAEAEQEMDILRKKADAEDTEKAPAVDMETVRETLNDLVADGLTKKASVEPALELIEQDPTNLCSVIAQIGQIAKKAGSESSSTETESVGALVPKKAAAQVSRHGGNLDLDAMMADAGRRIEEKVASYQQ